MIFFVYHYLIILNLIMEMELDIFKKEIGEYFNYKKISDDKIINYDDKYITEVHEIFIKENIKINYDNDFLNYCAGIFYLMRSEYWASINYLSRINADDGDLFVILAICYRRIKKFDLAEMYYTKAISNGNQLALINLGILYEQNKQYDLAEKFYLKSIDYGRESAIHRLASLYERQHKIDLAESYYLLALDKKSSHALIDLIKFYDRNNRKDLAIKYSIEALFSNEKDCNFGYKKINKVCNYNELKLYSLLDNITNKNQFINGKINELDKIRDVKYFKNKINLLSKEDQCPICLDEHVLVIPKECAHFYCRECYVEIKKCSICDNDIYESEHNEDSEDEID